MHAQADDADLQRYEGLEAEPPRISRFPVDQAMIQTWVEALDDDNPLYVDESAARSHGRPTVVAPPAMISAWVMSGYRRYRQVQAARERGVAEDSACSRLMGALDAQGFTSVVATDIEQEYHAEILPGVRVTCRSVIETVSPRKRTALGEGHFITLRKVYVDQDQRPLATELFRMLRFAPAPQPPVRKTGVPPLVRTQDNTFWFEAAAEGRLTIQRCSDCGELRHPPGPACPVCRSFRWDAMESTGKGALHSWTIVHHPQDAAFNYPLAVGLVDLDEGTRLVADIEQLPESGPTIGAAVHIIFAPHAHGEILPRVRFDELSSAGADGVDTAEEHQRREEAIPESQLRAAGIALPMLRIPLDRTAIIAGALASQDFEDVHHDPSRALERGMQDIFLSINTTNGLVDRFLTDWAGPGLRIHSVMLRLGVPQFAGDVLEFRGTAHTLEDERTRVELIGTNKDGVHVTATAIVSGASHKTEEGR